MAKRKRTTVHTNDVKKQSSSGIPSPPHEQSALEQLNSHTVISPDEIELAVETLETLSKHPAIIKSKVCKELRTAVFDFRQACTTGINSAGDYESSVFKLFNTNYSQRRVAISQHVFRQRSQMPSTWTHSSCCLRCASEKRHQH